jgi:hypothetical protein
MPNRRWKEILADSKIADDFVISLGDGTSRTMGEIRAEDRESEGALSRKWTQQEEALRQREAQLGAAEIELMQRVDGYAKRQGISVEDFIMGKGNPASSLPTAPSRRDVAAQTGLDENDPLVGEVVKQLKALTARLDKTDQELLTQRDKILKPITATYLNDYYELQWERTKNTLPKKAQEKLTYDDALKHAERRGLKDRAGRLDVAAAAQDLASPFVQDEWRDQERAKLRKELKDEAFASSLPKPGQTGPRGGVPKSFKDEKGRTKSFDQVLNDAAQDAELWRGIATEQ